MKKKKPFATEEEELQYHLDMQRDLMQKLLTLAKEEPDLANQLLRQMMLSAELLVSNQPEFKEEFRQLVKEVDAEIRKAVELPVGRVSVKE
mgnify:CR=1 FL=1